MGMIDRLHEKHPVIYAVAYARYSSDMQREESIEAQFRSIEDFARHNGIEIVQKYADRGISGTTDQRPDFQQMISDAKTGKYQLVLIHKLDRFARDRIDSMCYRRELKKSDVLLFSVTEQLDSDSPESIMMESIIDAMNECYVLNLSREVSKGLKENAYKCLHTGGVPPLGYDLDEFKHLVINEQEAEAVRTIFDMVLMGDGYGAILRTLNARNLKTKLGRSFGKGSLYEILRNEKYCGTYVYNRSSSKKLSGKYNRHKYKDESEIIRVEDGIPAIISKSTFQKVQEIMGSRKRTQGRFSAKENYLLSGKLICGECGSHYIGFARKARPDHPYYVNYQCAKKHHAVQCSNTGIAKDDIEHFVLEKIAAYIFNDALVPQIIEAYKAYFQSCNSDFHKRFTTATNRLHGIDKQIDNIVNVMAQTGSTALIQKLNSLETERADLKSEISSMQQKLSENQIDEGKIRLMFDNARTMFLQGKLSANKALIDKYVKKF